MREGEKLMSSLKGEEGQKRRESVDPTRELSRLSLVAGKMFIALSHDVPLLVECQEEKKGGGGGGGGPGGGGGG